MKLTETNKQSVHCHTIHIEETVSYQVCTYHNQLGRGERGGESEGEKIERVQKSINNGNLFFKYFSEWIKSIIIWKMFVQKINFHIFSYHEKWS